MLCEGLQLFPSGTVVRMQADEQGGFPALSVLCGGLQRRGIEMRQETGVLVRVIPERRGIEDEIFPFALRELRVERPPFRCHRGLPHVLLPEEVVRDGIAGRDDLARRQAERAHIDGTDGLCRTGDVRERTVRADLLFPDFLRLRDVEPELFERALTVPDLDDRGRFVRVDPPEREEIVVDENGFRATHGEGVLRHEAEHGTDAPFEVVPVHFHEVERRVCREFPLRLGKGSLKAAVHQVEEHDAVLLHRQPRAAVEAEREDPESDRLDGLFQRRHCTHASSSPARKLSANARSDG